MRLTTLSGLLLLALLLTGCAPGRPASPTPELNLESNSGAAEPTASPAFTPKEPRPQSPGPLRSPDGSPLQEEQALGFMVLGSDGGTCTIGCWPSLQPTFQTLLVTRAELYKNARVTVTDDFIQIAPAHPLEAKETSLKSHPFQPVPGLAYANAQGVLLASLTAAAPPKNFFVVGQSTFDLNTVDAWRANLGNTVHTTGGLRT